VNKLRGGMRVAAVRAPDFGDRREAMLEEIANRTGGVMVSKYFGIRLESVTLDMLGTAKKVVIEKEKTTIIGGGGKKIGMADAVSIPINKDGVQTVIRAGGGHAAVRRRDIPRIDFGPSDAALLPDMDVLIARGEANSPYAAALALSGKAKGTGGVAAKAKRLAHRYKQWKAEQG
jgi:hypothetical protein